MQGTIGLLIALNILLGGAMAIAGCQTKQGKSIALVSSAAVLAASILLIPPDVFRRTYPVYPGRLIHYVEGATDTVGVTQYGDHVGIVYEDRRGTAATNSYPWNYVLGHLPVLLHPGEPSTGLHICFGVGNSLSAFAAHDSITSIDSVELSPHVLEAARFFWTNNDVIDNPKVNTIIEDGRNFVMATDKVYDVIEMEPPEPFTAGVINLYTREFYEEIDRILADDGVFMQWMFTGTGSYEDMLRLYRAFFDVFPNATAWQLVTNPGTVLMIGTKTPLQIDYQRFSQKARQYRVRRDLQLSGIRTPDDLFSLFLFGPPTLRTLLDGVETITDDRTVLDFSMARHHGSGYGFGFFPLLPQVEGAEDPWDEMKYQSDQFWAIRESIAPYVTNLGDVDVNELDRRVKSRELIGFQELLRRTTVRVKRDTWNRCPAEP